MNYIKAWYIASNHGLTFILIAWVLVGISIWFSWRVPASGSILVGFAVVAELFLASSYKELKTRINGLATPNNNSFDFPGKWNQISDRYDAWMHFDFRPFTQLAKENEFRNDQWLFAATIARVDQRLMFFYAFNAIVGTILWGYGDLIFEPQNCY